MLVTILVFVFASAVEAQIDPSSAMLLNSSRTNTTPRDGGLDTGRYTVKPKSDVPRTTHKTEVKVRVEETVVTTTPSPTATPSPNPVAVATPTPPQQPPQRPPQKPPQQAPQQAPQNPPQQPPQGSTFEPQEVGVPTYERAPIDERRLTLLELSFAPGYMYNESKSTFAPRNYILNSPSMSVDAAIWVNPNFGVHTGFTSSLNASVTDSFDNTKNATASEQWFSAGLRGRSFFSDGPKAPVLSFGLDYREFEFKVPSDSLVRNKLTTTGLHLLLDAEMPTSGLGTWNLGGEFGPKLSHRESSNAVEFRTGNDPQATTVEVHIGAQYRFNHTNALFWKISYSVERDLFTGSTSINDPLTGSPQTNVSVTNAFTFFQLGYTWGN